MLVINSESGNNAILELHEDFLVNFTRVIILIYIEYKNNHNKHYIFNISTKDFSYQDKTMVKNCIQL